MANVKKTTKATAKRTSVKKAPVKKVSATKTHQGQKKLSTAANYVSKNDKSMIIYLLLAWFFGMLGGHKFYIGKTGQGVAMLLMTLVGWVLVIPIIVVWIWVLVDIIVGLINFTTPDKILGGK